MFLEAGSLEPRSFNPSLSRNPESGCLRPNFVLTRRDAMKLGLAVPVGIALPAGAFSLKPFWESKPPEEWTPDEIDRLITDSPWAKKASVSAGEPGERNRSGRRGVGFPGGGIGLPGRGGIGFPGGYPGGRTGGGYPGGGYPRGPSGPTGQTSPSGDQTWRNFTAIVRWDSALPVQLALKSGRPEDKRDPDLDKYYIVHLLGDLPMLGGRSGRDDDDDSAGNQRREEMFKQYTKLERRQGMLLVEKVEQGSRIGANGPGVLFYFSRLDNISAGDKQVTFVTKLGPSEIKAKFDLKDMTYQGKLAL
jgi:hypothetical protein